jgi:hypothetical protein
MAITFIESIYVELKKRFVGRKRSTNDTGKSLT